MTTSVDIAEAFRKDLKRLRHPYPRVIAEVTELVTQEESEA